MGFEALGNFSAKFPITILTNGHGSIVLRKLTSQAEFDLEN